MEFDDRPPSGCRKSSMKSFRIANHSSGFLVITLSILSLPIFSIAKTREHADVQTAFFPSPGRKIDASFVKDYETRMRRFLEARIKGPKAILDAAQSSPVRESDLLMIAPLWNRLSPSFKTLYLQAVQIPGGYTMRVSPGGHFEVYYTTEDPDEKVDDTDTLGYGNIEDWRSRTPGPNGIPDYIDEVAWALDSSWSLHVDRSGFIAPLSYRDSRHPSSRYKAVVTLLAPDDYGYTYPMGKLAPDSLKGYTSLLQLRNHWNGETWQNLGYEERPQDGVRVTCAHELFHAVQYTMTWNTPAGNDLDDFPITFIEGTAVLMEEIAFDYINDYIQYAAAFFSNPRIAFFDGSGGQRAYTNSILTKYIYEKGGSAPTISLFRQMMFTNYSTVTEFHANLRTASIASGTSWPLLLNRFHTGSFYSGTRADTSRFIADARLLGHWNYLIDTIPASFAITRQVDPYAMQIFAFSKESGDNDTLFVGLEGQIDNQGTVPSPSWAISCVVRSDSRPDTIISIPMGQDGKGSFRIDEWLSYREMLILATNGHPDRRRSLSVMTSEQPSDTDNALYIFPNPGRLGRGTAIHFRAPDITEIRIYAASGPLICASGSLNSAAFKFDGRDYLWNLVNGSGKKIAPGTYMALIIRKGPHSGQKTSTLQKVLVFP
jgi:hypothetical protein